MVDSDLAEILTPEQLDRYRQLELQTSLQFHGPIHLLHFRFVVERLDLTEEQAAKLRAAHSEFVRRGEGGLVPATAEERNNGQRTIDAVLSSDQKERWRGLFGEILTMDDFGQVELPDFAATIVFPSFVKQLRLTDSQVKAIREKRAAAAGEGARARGDSALREVLTAEQVHRYRQIQLQMASRRAGPMYLLRYRRVVEAIAPTEEQAAKLKSAYENFMSRFWLPLVVTSEERATSQDTIDAILSAEQRARWKELLGESLSSSDESHFPSTTTAGRDS